MSSGGARPDPTGHLERESDLLKRELPPTVARGLAELLILLFLLATTFVVFVRLPVSVNGRFVLEADGGSDPVNAEHDGVVEAVGVQVGSTVLRGATLLVVRSDDLRRLAAERMKLDADVAEARRRLESFTGEPGGSDLAARVERLQREVESARTVRDQSTLRQEALVSEARSDSSRLAKVVAARKARVDSLQSLVEQHEALEAQGIVAKSALFERREALSDAEAELEEARRDRARAEASIGRLATERLVDAAQQESALAKMEGELAEALALRGEETHRLEALIDEGARQVEAMDRVLTTSQGDLWRVIAPYDGVVVALDVERPGVSIARGQKLAVVARAGARLHAEIEVPEQDVGRISSGQGVRLMLDAYPYTRHGIVPATLSWVSPAAVGGKVPARADVSRATLLVDGIERPLQQGLGGVARIDTGRQTLLHFVIEPLARLRATVASSPDGVAPLPAGPRVSPMKPKAPPSEASEAD